MAQQSYPQVALLKQVKGAGNADRARMIHAIGPSIVPPSSIQRRNAISEAISTTRPRVALWGAKIVVALAFFAAGVAKLAGAQAMIDIFNVIGLGQWFRYVTGAIEVIGAILILIPSLAGIGALLLACTMAGAVITHLTVLPASPLPALILFALSAAIAWLHRDHVVNLFPKSLADRN